MTEINYQNLAWPVRDEVTAVQRHAWERLGAPGTWLTGAERIAIAAEARHAKDCQLCQRRKDALSPYNVNGEHDALGALSPDAVEAILAEISELDTRVISHLRPAFPAKSIVLPVMIRILF